MNCLFAQKIGLKAVLVARLVDAINKEKENQSDSESSDDENRDPNTPKKEKVKKEIPQNKEDENSGEQSSEEENSEDGSSEDESSEEELSEKETETVEEIPASPAGSIADNLPTRSTPNGHPNEYPPEEFGHSTAEERAVKVWEEHSAAWMATVQEVAAQVHPDLPLTTGAAHLLRSYALHVLMHLKSHTEAHAPKHPLMATDLQRAVAAKYPADLAAHATEEIHRAVRLARESLNATQDVGGPVEGLVVEPAAVAKLWRTLGGATLSVGAAAAVAAVVEYLWAEVVELGGHAAHRYGHVALTALTLRQGVNADSELSGLLWMTPVTSSSWRVAAAHLWQALATETAEECAAAQFSLSAALATLTAQRSVAESLQTLPATDDVIALRSQLRLERVSTHGRQWTVGGVRWQWKEKSDPVQPAESILSDPELVTAERISDRRKRVNRNWWQTA